MKTQNKYKFNNLKATKPILLRLVVFLLCFVIASGIIGPRIIGRDLVGKYGFQIYGGAGKALLFGSLAFILLFWRKNLYPKLYSWEKYNLIWFVLAIVSILIEWKVINKLINRDHYLLLIFAAHIFIIATILFLLVFSFGLRNIKKLFLVYKKELLLSIGMAIIFVAFLYIIYELWTVLASVALNSVRYMLNLIGIHAIYEQPQSLILNKFGIRISKYCSGIDSIALFTALYGLIGVLDWNRFNHRKYAIVFLPALIVLFGFNILRIFVLILGGYYISPAIAFNLFHTYAGMILFIVYSFIFWGVIYGWMLRKDRDNLNSIKVARHNGDL